MGKPLGGNFMKKLTVAIQLIAFFWCLSSVMAGQGSSRIMNQADAERVLGILERAGVVDNSAMDGSLYAKISGVVCQAYSCSASSDVPGTYFSPDPGDSSKMFAFLKLLNINSNLGNSPTVAEIECSYDRTALNQGRDPLTCTWIPFQTAPQSNYKPVGGIQRIDAGVLQAMKECLNNYKLPLGDHGFTLLQEAVNPPSGSIADAFNLSCYGRNCIVTVRVKTWVTSETSSESSMIFAYELYSNATLNFCSTRGHAG